ncbi:hypothetical protein L4D76_24500 [Photobacterium sagamiensis]|uniref:hypothetical protein n=1 Tax=Photobacterium sagamiensis TaxID=2910241 RepID=UPI003D122743
MAQAQAQVQVNTTPTAAESLAAMHAMFGSKSEKGMIYDHLPDDIKRTVCFAAGLKQRHTDMRLAEMSQFERAQLHRAINKLADALKPLANCSLKEFH